ncbi:hypothetical protein VN12_09330 [Pirellula sp. SH-Sr6A]|uniref:hypothetical protein n=1 Tax=Pirellula sp. SH-Sr6A TaxID=1632865 RepID=UPI00078B61C9|nr:hypothetical protein [Pirellula sp. SH-Sr6A]AMV32313.1 hypothetical protein VN12_09330 [Pirellula sp. SH-Sr6A]
MKSTPSIRFPLLAVFVLSVIPALGCSEDKKVEIPEKFVELPTSDTPTSQKKPKPDSSESD